MYEGICHKPNYSKFCFYHLDAFLLNIKSETNHTTMSKHFHIQSNRDIVETDAKTIPLLTHIYMTAHFSGFLRVYNKNNGEFDLILWTRMSRLSKIMSNNRLQTIITWYIDIC